MATVFDVTERPVFGLGPDVTVLNPSGIASGAALGTVQANTTSVAAGVASGAGVGTAKSVAVVSLAGVGASGAVGTAQTFMSATPAGIAGSGGTGTPSLVMVLSPSGIGSSEAFGDADTLATVFIIPGPLDPSNDLGNATATKRGWIFRPPVNTYKWRLFKEYEGISLLKENGVWSEVAHPDLPRTKAAERYLAGGRDHVVGDALKAELVALGYTVTDEVVTTEEYL